jgi:hypothetical protein
LLWAASNTLAAWTRHVADAVGQPPVAPVTAWLIGRLHVIRRDPQAGQMFDEFTWLTRAVDGAVIGRGPLDFFGRCDQIDVRVQARVLHGPSCRSFMTAPCTHESCAVIAGREQILDTVTGVCGADLYGTQDAKIITCDVCGAAYDARDRKTTMRAAVADQLATVNACASGLSQLDQPVTVQQINAWIRGHRIPARGRDSTGAVIIKVGDVQAVIAENIERRHRPRETA